MNVKNHNHAEAFMLMRYQSDDGDSVEWIWNSQNGVTPFFVLAKDGRTLMSHVRWRDDEYRPGHRLQPGDRYFGPITPEAAARYAEERMKQFDWTEYELQGDERREMQASLTKAMLDDSTPDLLVFKEPEPPPPHQ